MDYLRFRYDLVVEIVEPDLVFLISELEHHILEGRIYAQLAPLLNGQISVEKIIEQLHGEASPAQIYYALRKMRRYLVEDAAEIDNAQAAYWQLQEIKTEQSNDLAVHVFGDIPALPDFFDTFRFHQAADASLHLVITDDYLNPELNVFNREALVEKRSWLLVKPVGALLWAGPFFIPGETACWECMAQRLRTNRGVEGFIQHTKQYSKAITVSRAALPSTTAAALSIAVTEAARWLHSGKSELLEQLLVLDTRNWQSYYHTVVKRPQCPVCGSTEPVKPQPLALTSQSKVEGGRAVTPEETFMRYRHHISPITGAVTMLERVRGLGPLYVYSAGTNHSRPYDHWHGTRRSLRSHSAGKGIEDIQAQVSGLCEALERYSGVFRGDEPRFSARFHELEDAIHPNDLLLFSEAQYATRETWNVAYPPHLEVSLPFDAEREIEWSPVWSLSENRFKYVPTLYCYYHYPPDHEFCTPDSNGNAAGSSLEDAIVQGFMELVERDSVAIWWYNRVQHPKIELESIDHPFVERLQTFYHSLHRDIWVLDLTSDLSIPAIVAISRRNDKSAEDIIMGFGAHFDAQTAVLRALTEVTQMLPSVTSVGLDGKGSYYSESRWEIEWWQTATLENEPYLAPSPKCPPKSVTDYASLGTDDLREDVLTCAEVAQQHGMEMLVLDQTRPDIGLPVVKVIVPGMRHFWNRFAPGRLYTVPVDMGWQTEATPEDALNRRPMML